jgi:hypothetical protein
MGARNVAVRRHHHALTGGQPVIFHHPGGGVSDRSEPVQCRFQTCWAVHDLARRGADAGRRHHVFSERFGAFDPRRGLTGPETGDAGVAQDIGYPEHQGNLGADDNQVRPNLAGQSDDVITRNDVDLVLIS